MGTLEDASEAYLYCMRNTFLTGQDISIEGRLLLTFGFQA